MTRSTVPLYLASAAVLAFAAVAPETGVPNPRRCLSIPRQLAGRGLPTPGRTVAWQLTRRTRLRRVGHAAVAVARVRVADCLGPEGQCDGHDAG